MKKIQVSTIKCLLQNNKRNIINIIFIILIILDFIFIHLIIVNRRNFNKMKSDVNAKIANLSLKNDFLKRELENTKKELYDSQERECQYTRTYRYLETYNYIGEYSVNKYIIVDQFQNYRPIILEYDASLFDIELQKNEYYEITFKSNINNGLQSWYQIIDIVHTNKIGLEQLQEEC